MNIVNKLTLRHMKLNKRRTIVTIIGVIISVAMITAVATISTSFMSLMQRQSIAQNGEWHVLYNDVNQEQLEAIKKDEETKTVVISRDTGYAELEGSQNSRKPYLFVKEYNTAGFYQFPITLSEGRLPQAPDEVVISAEITETAKVNYKLGDLLSLEVGQRFVDGISETRSAFNQTDSLVMDNDNEMSVESIKDGKTRSYTVVGIIERPEWEPAWAPGYTIISYVDESLLSENDRVNVSVVLKKVKKSLYAHAEKLSEELDIQSKRFNNELLRYYGISNNNGLNALLIQMSAIIMTVIIIGSVSLIYNAFAISVSERSRHLGMLSSVGATRRQKRNSVFFEGAIIGLISIPLGIISGLVGIGVTFMFINSAIQDALGMTESLIVTVTPMSIAVACAVSALTIFISTYLPARKASKVSAIDAIRQSTDIKLTGKAVKTSRLVRRLFGFEAEIGLKNLKRNKRRYQATVFSLVISIVLFLVVSYFTDNLKKGLALSQDGVNYDIELWMGSEILDDSFIQAVINLENVTEHSQVKELDGLYTWVNEAQMSDTLRKRAQEDPDSLTDGKLRLSMTLIALDDASLKAYAAKVGASYEALLDPNQMNAIVVDLVTYANDRLGKYVEEKAIHTSIGESIPLHTEDYETETVTEVGEIKVSALTDQLPMGVYTMWINGVNMIVSEQTLMRLNAGSEDAGHPWRLAHRLLLKSSDPMKTQNEINEIQDHSYGLSNHYKYRQQEEQMIMLMSVFTYGFILLITAISVANIFNTISTSISLRKREFAMLKSVGMTPKGFNKMINYESIFYGMKSLLYGLPISIAIMVLIHRAMMNTFSYSFTLPWVSLLYVIIAVFVIVGAAMMYSSSKVKRENIIDAIKQESI